MNYIKSAGFFSIFYVILYFGLSIGLRFFITDSDLFTGLFYVVLLAATLIYLKICGDDIKTTLRIHPIHIGSFFLIILLAFTIRPVARFITLIANLFFKDMTTTTMTQKVMQNLSLSILTTAFLPGLVEETIFRGVVYSRVRKANPIKGILLSALFFGIAHMNFQQFCYAFFLGIVFGFLIEASDSILSSMTAHMVFNGSSLLLTYLLSKTDIFNTAANTASGNVSSTDLTTIIASIPMALIGLVLSILLIIAIAYLNGRLGYMKTWFYKQYRASWPKEKSAGFSFFAAVGVCFLFSILMEISAHII